MPPPLQSWRRFGWRKVCCVTPYPLCRFFPIFEPHNPRHCFQWIYSANPSVLHAVFHATAANFARIVPALIQPLYCALPCIRLTLPHCDAASSAADLRAMEQACNQATGDRDKLHDKLMELQDRWVQHAYSPYVCPRTTCQNMSGSF